MVNMSLFEAAGLNFINSSINELDKTTPHEVILNLKGLEDEFKDIKIFILVKKNKNSNYILYYRNKYYHDVSIIADYLPVVIQKQCNGDIMHIFNPHY